MSAATRRIALDIITHDWQKRRTGTGIPDDPYAHQLKQLTSRVNEMVQLLAMGDPGVPLILYRNTAPIQAKARSVSHVAFHDEKRCLIYAARVKEDQSLPKLDGTDVNLEGPGGICGNQDNKPSTSCHLDKGSPEEFARAVKTGQLKSCLAYPI